MTIVCSMTLVASVPYASWASFDDAVANVHKQANEGRDKIRQRIAESEKNINLKKENLEKADKKIKDCENKIESLIKKHESAKTDEEFVLAANSLSDELTKEQYNLCSSREILDNITAVLLSCDNDNNLELRDDLLESKDAAQKNYDDISKKVNDLEKQLKELKIQQDDSKNFEADLKALSEEKQKCESEIAIIKKEIEECQNKHDELIAESLSFEDNVNNEICWLEHLDAQNKKNLDDWNRICAGDQREGNELNGHKIINTCGIFAATNVINYFNFIENNGKPIQGFKDVITYYLNNGGDPNCLNRFLSFNEFDKYLTSNKINAYDLVYEDKLGSMLPETARREQADNIKEFIKAHFRSNNKSPILNVSCGHWRTFAAYDEIDDKILVVDSLPAKVQWMDLDSVARGSVAIFKDEVKWEWVFFSKDKPGEGYCFGKYYALTPERKSSVIKKLLSF